MAAHEEVWNRRRKQVGARDADKAETFVLTAMDRRTQHWLAEHKRTIIASAAVTITRRQLAHAGRQKKPERGQGLDEADWARLPAIVHDPDAILYDNRDPGLPDGW